MRAIVVYPLPFDAWSEFEKYARRFATTMLAYPPGVIDYELWVVCNWGDPTDQEYRLFRDFKVRFLGYDGHGCDIGSALCAAEHAPHDALVLSMTSRCYFHRPNWLQRYVEARQKYGPGLYGASVSYEGGKLHVCTRAYAMDAELWKRYPHIIDTRAKGQKFEVGEWCLTDWVKSDGLPIHQVTWDGERSLEEARCPEEQAIFRRNGQGAMLVWDKWTDHYAKASLAERVLLEAKTDGAMI